MFTPCPAYSLHLNYNEIHFPPLTLQQQTTKNVAMHAINTLNTLCGSREWVLSISGFFCLYLKLAKTFSRAICESLHTDEYLLMQKRQILP